MSEYAESMLQDLVRDLLRRQYGKHRGFVTDNADPQQRARIKVRVPSVLGDQETDWALPCLPFGGLPGQGSFAVPEVGAQVWVEFEEGDLQRPIWTGTFWQQEGDAPEDAARQEPTTRLLQTPGGHILQLDDEQGNERFRLYHPSGAELTIDAQGVVTLTDPAGSVLTLDGAAGQAALEDGNGNSLRMGPTGTNIEDASGNAIEMAPSGLKVTGTQVTVEGSLVLLGGTVGEPLIKGSTFLTLFATHVHTTTAPGSPTSPPIPQGEATALSTTVMSA